jgi:hypothetical protein
MYTNSFPATLSPCVRVFVEMLCDEATTLSPRESLTQASFAQAGQSQPQNSIEAK